MNFFCKQYLLQRSIMRHLCVVTLLFAQFIAVAHIHADDLNHGDGTNTHLCSSCILVEQLGSSVIIAVVDFFDQTIQAPSVEKQPATSLSPSYKYYLSRAPPVSHLNEVVVNINSGRDDSRIF